MKMFFLLLLVLILPVKSAITGEWNAPDRDSYEPKSGRLCEEEDEASQPAGLNFYVDSYRERVYAFYFNGCDGDGNAYADVPTAEKNLPTDSAQCDGFNMTGWPIYGEDGEIDHRCPQESYYLNYGEYSALCCDNATAERYREELKSVCPDNSEPLTHNITYKNAEDEVEKEEIRRLIGRNCSHNFCPVTHSCHQGEFEAFCCLKPIEEEAIITEKSPEVETPAGLEGIEDGFSSLWIVVLGVIILTLIISGIIFFKRRQGSKYIYDQREVSALNP